MKIKQLIFGLDWSIILVSLLLSLIGIISIYSKGAFYSGREASFSSNQFYYLILALLLIIIIAVFINLNNLIHFSFFLYLIGNFFLVITLFLGTTLNQSKSWLRIGTFGFQPSELMKIFLCLFLAYYLSRKNILNLSDIFVSLIITAVPIVLVLLQPDLGTVLVYIFTWIIMILNTRLSRSDKKALYVMLSLGIISILILFFSGKAQLSGYQVERLKVYPDHLFLNFKYHSGIGYQVDQSLIAISSSGFFGKGLGQGTQSQLGFLPETYTDFIFASIIEELGIFSAILIFALFSFLLFRIYIISTLNIPSSIYFFTVGISSVLVFHIVQNVGMNIGLLPVTGIPLPFLSLGGTFLLTCFISIGLLESVILRYKSI